MRIGVIGCGNIGRIIVEAVYNGTADCEIAGVFDICEDGFYLLPANIMGDIRFTTSFDEFLNYDFELAVEAASQKAVREYGIMVLDSGRDIMVMSAGAFSDDSLLLELKEAAEKKGLKIYIPSGAIAGIDGVKSANIAAVESVTLTTTKNPGGLGVDANKKTVLYEGPAREAVKKFPANVNVAATLSLAGIGLDKTKVRIIADPKVKNNIHEISVRGDFGELKTRVENVPSPRNPKTSYLAALSAIATLKRITEAVKVGT